MAENISIELQQLNFRLLRAEEFERPDIKEVFSQYKSSLPSPTISQVMIAENSDGKLAALHVMQPMFHAEPIYVAPEYRKTLLHLKIARKLLELYEGIKGLNIFAFSTTENDFSATLSRLGFRELPYKVFVKEIK